MNKEEAFDIISDKVINVKVDSVGFSNFISELLEIIDNIESEYDEEVY